MSTGHSTEEGMSMAKIRVLLQVEMVQPQEGRTPEELEADYIGLIGDHAGQLGGTLYVVRSSSYVEAPADPPELPMEPEVPVFPVTVDVAPEQSP
jgi:hypothetical protein